MAAGADEPELVEVHTTGTITKMLPAHRGQVVVAGSPGGVYAGWCAAAGGARAVILNDAGVGKDQADAADMLASGLISAVNRTAAALGCAPGQTVLDCAGRMRSASLPAGPVPQLRDSRIVVTASHGALVGGRPNEVVPSGVFAAFFHDAGGARAGSGYSRLASLDALGVVAGTVAADSARVGDARSCYQDGVPPHVNGTARERGGHRGLALHAAIDTLRQA